MTVWSRPGFGRVGTLSSGATISLRPPPVLKAQWDGHRDPVPLWPRPVSHAAASSVRAFARAVGSSPPSEIDLLSKLSKPPVHNRTSILSGATSIRPERRLCQEVKMNLAYRWFCGLGPEDKVRYHSTFSVDRHGRFRDSDILRKVFEKVVCG